MNTIIIKNNLEGYKKIILMIFLINVFFHVHGLVDLKSQTKQESRYGSFYNTEKRSSVFINSPDTLKTGNYCDGNIDLFVCPPENTVQDVSLSQKLINQYMDADCFSLLKFDEIPNRPSCVSAKFGFFIHKMVFDVPSGGVTTGSLTISIKAAPTNNTKTNYIAFYEGGNLLSGALLKDLPGSSGTWNNNQTATFTLNLASLPSGFNYPNVLPYMQDGNLDVLVGTNSGVDYMCLSISNRNLNVGLSWQLMQYNPDSLIINVRNPSPPFAIVDSGKVYTNFTGSHQTAALTLNNAITGNSYYIELKHRNSISTWTANPVVISETTTYDFTTSASKAYGDNLIEVNGNWSIYQGDIDQNGSVNLSDIISVYNAAATFVVGYVNTDLDANGIVNLSDLIGAYNNASKFVVTKAPSGALSIKKSLR